uniref:Uncharacterized protein n=1 Tax=Anguilla anguilla TaxID=7936 RepID=A0A0E9W4I8_ANGAN
MTLWLTEAVPFSCFFLFDLLKKHSSFFDFQ